ncbi:MAG: alpha/beta hydrolase [Desulfobacterales bacterium]|nr:alpha/beta hydrolase [Desulfobacterales bacterium]
MNIPDYIEVGSGKTVLFLPGLEGAKEFWKYQIDDFSKKYHTVSCGYIRKIPRLSSNVAEYVSDVIDLMDFLNIEKAAVIAESFGGMVAQELTLQYPSRVDALVLCNTFDKARYKNFGINMFTIATFLHPFAFGIPRRSFKKGFLNWVGKYRGFVMDPSEGNDNLSDYVLDYGLHPGFLGYIHRILAGLKGNYASKLSEIKTPALIVRGVEDRVVDDGTILGLVGRIKGAELALIDGGGHCCQYTLPEKTNTAILDWLERIGY